MSSVEVDGSAGVTIGIGRNRATVTTSRNSEGKTETNISAKADLGWAKTTAKATISEDSFTASAQTQVGVVQGKLSHSSTSTTSTTTGRLGLGYSNDNVNGDLSVQLEHTRDFTTNSTTTELGLTAGGSVKIGPKHDDLAGGVNISGRATIIGLKKTVDLTTGDINYSFTSDFEGLIESTPGSQHPLHERQERLNEEARNSEVENNSDRPDRAGLGNIENNSDRPDRAGLGNIENNSDRPDRAGPGNIENNSDRPDRAGLGNIENNSERPDRAPNTEPENSYGLGKYGEWGNQPPTVIDLFDPYGTPISFSPVVDIAEAYSSSRSATVVSKGYNSVTGYSSVTNSYGVTTVTTNTGLTSIGDPVKNNPAKSAADSNDGPGSRGGSSSGSDYGGRTDSSGANSPADVAADKNAGHNSSSSDPGGSGGGSKGPVIIDLDGDGVSITELSQSNIFLDTTDDGLQNRTAWAGAGDAVLFYDPDNLDAINETRQFVFTEWDPTADSDIDALRSVFDSNHDGKLNASDDDFADFKLLVTNADGSTSVVTLAAAGIVEIDLNPDAMLITLPDGSQITGQTSYTFSDGTTGVVADVTLQSGILSYKVVQTTSTDANGARTVDTKGFSADGVLAFAIVSVTSSDGSDTRNEYDDNGDGTVDRVQTILTTEDAAGVETRTVTNWIGANETDGVLANREVTTTSADGKVITIERDSTGGGWFDERETRTTNPDDSVTIEVLALAEDGSVIAKRVDTVATDGQTRTREIDIDGDLDTDTEVTETISVDANGVKTETVSISNGDGSLRSSSAEVTSANGQQRTISDDFDGDGDFDTVTSSSISVATDGSTTSTRTVTNQDGSLRNSSTTTQSDDARSKTVVSDIDGDGNVDLTTSSVTTIVNDVRTDTVTLTNGDGSIRSKAETILQADGVSKENWVDLNQDGVFQASDLISSVTVDGVSGDRTATAYGRNADGSVNSSSVSVTSEDGLTVSTTTDADGDGDTDVSVSDITVTHADGSSTRTVEVRNGDGTLNSKAITDTSADGLTSTTTSDIDGDGINDGVMISDTDLNADGSNTRTISEYAGDGTTLLSQVVIDESADRLTQTVSTDVDGDGSADLVEYSVEAADGSTTYSTNSYNPDGTLASTSSGTVSANGLHSVTSFDADADGANETIITEDVEYKDDGSTVTTTDVDNGDSSQRSMTIETVSDDGLVATTEIDSDGNGTFEQKIVATTTLNADGSATTVAEAFAENGDLLSKTESTINDDGLELETKYDADADGDFDFVETEVTTLNADGSTTVVRELRDEAGVLRDQTAITTSDNGRYRQISEDVNGDGLVDNQYTTTIADNGVRTTEIETFDTLGNLLNKAVETTSANGLARSMEYDRDGNGIFEDTTNVTSVLNVDGSVTTTETITANDGSIISERTSITSHDGLSTTATEDIDGDGTVDFTTTGLTVIETDGDIVETVSEFSADGTLANKLTRETSADRRSVTESVDLDGDGNNDVITSIVLEDDGSVKSTSNHVSTTGVIHATSERITSSDGLTSTLRLDHNADGEAELVVTEKTVLDGDGSVSREVSYRDDKYISYGNEQYSTSDDGLNNSVSFDVDGDGTFERKTEDQTTLNADGSVTREQITNSDDDTQIASVLTSVSGDGLETSVQSDFDEDGAIDRVYERTDGADGSFAETTTLLSSTGAIQRSSSATQTADGRLRVTEYDEDGDGNTDFRSRVELDLNGDIKETLSTLDADGNVNRQFEISQSANGHSETVDYDVDGDGTTDISRTSEQTYSNDGSSVTTIQKTDGDGNVISSEIITTSADGLSSQSAVDVDGDGTVDVTTETTFTLQDDGSETLQMVSSYSDGSIRTASSSYVSNDSRESNYSYDYDGDGITDLAVETSVDSNAETTSVRTTFNDAGYEESKQFTTTSADGLETVIVRGTSQQTITRSPGVSGSYTYEYQADVSSGGADFTSTHTIDALGIDTWTVTSSAGSTTVSLDSTAKEMIFAEAEAIYDTILDRDLSRLEYEQIAENITDGLLDRSALVSDLLDSSEFAERYDDDLSDAEFLDQIYQNSFNRSASLSELNAYLDDLDSGTIDRESLAIELAFSDEHQIIGNGHRLTNNFNVDSEFVKFEHTTDRAQAETLVKALIAVVYGRDAVAHELETFGDRILEGDTTLFDLASDLLALSGGIPGTASNSLSEFVTNFGSYDIAEFVKQAYVNALGREPTTTEASDWEAHITSGNITAAEFIALLAQSPESRAVIGDNVPTTIDATNQVTGTSAAETLAGTTGDDNLIGLEGNDTLYGYAGDDTLIGGAGDDYLRGDAGNDRYEWSKGDGNDNLYDYSASTTEVDTLVLTDVTSEDVNLTRTGAHLYIEIISTGEVIGVTNHYYAPSGTPLGYGIETLEFSDGASWTLDDILENTEFAGTASADVLHGSHATDQLIGLAGNDTLRGYNGDDTLIGGLGNDTLNGEGGNDRYIWSKGDGNDTIYDTSTSTTETDTLVLTDVTSDDVSLTRTSGSADLKIEIISTGEVISVTYRFYGTLNSPSSAAVGYGIEAIEFSDGVSWDLDDILAQTSVSGTSGNNTLNGSIYAANMYGLEGNDTLNGYAGDDTLVGGLGDDLLQGGLDNDRYIWSKGDGNDTINDTSTSKSEVDTLVLTDVTSDDVSLTRTSGSADLKIEIISTGEVISVTNRFYGALNSPSSAAVGYGIEVIEFSDGASWDLDDILAQTSVSGTSGNNTLNGSIYAANMYGLEGNDTLNGYAGDDTLVGGLGDDLLQGGLDNDRYIWSKGDGNDTINDTSTSKSEVDTLVLTDVTSDDVSLTRTGAHLYIEIISTGEVIGVTNRFYLTNTGYGVEFIEFADGVVIELKNADIAEAIFTGTAGDNTLNGTELNDTINGRDGDDILNGNDGDDLISGGGGDDLIDGGAGTDTAFFTGNFSNYTVSFDGLGNLQISDIVNNGGTDTLTSFERYKFADGTLLSNIVYSAVGQGYLDLHGTDEGGIVNGGNARERIYGGDGDDVLSAGRNVEGGFQYLSGGNGNDTYNISKEDGLLFLGGSSVSESATTGIADKVVFTDLNLSDITIDYYDYGTSSVHGNTIRLKWNDGTNSGELRLAQEGNYIETFEFADGTTLSSIEGDWLARLYPETHSNYYANKFVGTSGDDIIIGSDRRDYVYAGDGDDTLSAGLNTDGAWQYLYGQSGNDTYNVSKEDGLVFITTAGETDTTGTADKVVFTDLNLSDITIDYHDYAGSGSAAQGNTLRLIWNDGTNSGELRLAQEGDYIETFEFADGTTLSSIGLDANGDLVLEGLESGETIHATSSDETISAHGGNDIVHAGAGDDLVQGGSGNDILYGDEGIDRIIGGIGDDILFGGSGDDTFVFTTGDGSDVIEDFEYIAGTGGDTLELDVDGISTYAELIANATDTTDGVELNLGNGDLTLLKGTQLAALDQDAFTFF